MSDLIMGNTQVSTDTALAAQFPTDFLWGAATSSYQIEGAIREDGRGPSIWDRFAATPGKTYQGDTGEIAVDHYHLMEQDVALMAELGLKAYRFSISWSRILPTGTGAVNQAGLDFYSRLVDSLLAKNIQPLVTLYHWDLPTALEDRGGWLNRETAYAFADYAEIVARHLGDRVEHWITHNEPWCAAYLGYGNGLHAPGIKDEQSAIYAGHNLLVSHGLALPRLRSILKDSAKIGIAPNLFPTYAMDEAPETAARVEHELDFRNRWFLDPLFKGKYPEHFFANMKCQAPDIQDGDLALISAPIDFLGINYYNPVRIGVVQTENAQGEPQVISDILPNPSDAIITEMNWEVYPQGLSDLFAWLKQNYAEVPAILITENGSAFNDQLSEDGHIADTERTHYLREHIAAIGRSLTQSTSAPVIGYCAWSLMDNFEWAEGYNKRFGLVYVDYATQKRTIKDSGRWYASFLSSARQ